LEAITNSVVDICPSTLDFSFFIAKTMSALTNAAELHSTRFAELYQSTVVHEKYPTRGKGGEGRVW
jgi:hypothetical protein